MSPADLRLVVVGTGIMGASHARVAASMRDVELVAVVDPDAKRGRAVAHASGAAFLPSINELAEVDAAVIATPTEFHVQTATALLDRGVHVLVEKPIAADPVSARALIDAADRARRILMVGHIERFNPAVLELRHLVDDIVHIDAARISPYSDRVKDDVVIDLMIHDIDIALHLAGERPSKVSAVGRRTRSETIDLVSAIFAFPSGITAALSASRIGQNKIRKLDITQTSNFVSVDLVRQDVAISRVDHSEFLSESGPRYRQSGVLEIPFLEQRGEPLSIELRHFIECVRDGAVPAVRGEDGLAALEVALEIRRQLSAV